MREMGAFRAPMRGKPVRTTISDKAAPCPRDGVEWDTLGRLHHKGMISDPAGKAKSLVLTKKGLRRSEELLATLFAKSPVA